MPQRQRQREGRWVVPRRIEVRVTSGRGQSSYFTEAIIAQPLLKIDAEVSSGRLLLVTKPGIMVDADDVAGPERRGEELRAPWGPACP